MTSTPHDAPVAGNDGQRRAGAGGDERRPSTGGTLNHHRVGAGEPLVLIHGVGHHWQGWRPVIEPLSRTFDVLACDSPGFGHSAPLPAGVRPNIAAYADAYERFFAERGLDRPHVAGNSMGGAIALELGRRGAVRSVTALSPAGFWTDAERRYCQRLLATVGTTPRPLRPLMRLAMRSVTGRRLLLSLLHGFPAQVPPSAAIAALDALWDSPVLLDALDAFDDYSFSDGEPLRGLPVTVAWGDRDRLLLYGRQAPRARRALPHARHLTLGAGHLPCYDDPAAVVSVIRSTAAAAH